MNIKTKCFSHRKTAIAVLSVLVLLLGACSKKTIGCADPETSKLARQVFFDTFRKNTSVDWYVGDSQTQFTKESLIKYMDGLTVQLINAVDQGYNEQTKKQECSGDLKIEGIDGKALSVSTPYSMQLTADGNNTVFSLPLPDQLQMNVATNAFAYMNKSFFYEGTWTGQLSCQDTEKYLMDGHSKLRAPFSAPVTLILNPLTDASVLQIGNDSWHPRVTKADIRSRAFEIVSNRDIGEDWGYFAGGVLDSKTITIESAYYNPTARNNKIDEEAKREHCQLTLTKK